jgi:hypothetical protein
MKLTILLMTTIFFQIAAKSVAQNITISEQNASLDKIFKELRIQSGYNFVYTAQTLEGVKKVNVKLRNVSLKEALEVCFEDQPITYVIQQNTVVVQRKPQVQKPLYIEVKGKVTDENGLPLPGISVRLKDSKLGVATDQSGAFAISVPNGDAVLLFSCVGYISKEEPLKGRNQLLIKLKADMSDLSEVVVSGYQKIERRRLTSSITTVDMNVLKTINQPNIDKLLQGQVPGLTIVSTSGAPGAIPQIRIRGTSTISGNVQPLWVVDGIILDDPLNVSVDDIMNNRNLIASGIGGINVDDIESINVLKDAAATDN